MMLSLLARNAATLEYGGESFMSEWYEVTVDDINAINNIDGTDRKWSLNKINSIYCYKINNQIHAVIEVFKIPEDKGVMWIDNFEVLKKYRGQGIGQRSVREFLKKCDCPITLIAESEEVAVFWV